MSPGPFHRRFLLLLAVAIAVFLVSLGAALPGRAQSVASAILQGTVTDPTGAVVPGAEVQVRNLDTALERTVHTTGAGRYVVSLLPPGRYRIRVQSPGFAPWTILPFELQVGQTASIDARLSLPRMEQGVQVSEIPALLQPEKTEVSSTLGQTAIRQLPINGRRWEDFVLLTSGVVADGGNGLVSYHGMSGLYNNNLVDGADNNQAFFSESRGRTRIPYVYSASAIQEFQVINQNYSAEFGRAAGGIVNAVTRSGTNQLHGEAFYFFRNSALLAEDPLAKARGEPKPHELRQQFGGALGGPLIRDRLFLFGSYDQQSRDFPVTVVTQSPNFADGCTLPECGPAMDFIRSLLGLHPRRGDQNLFLLKPDWVITPRHHLSVVYNQLIWRSPNGILRDPVITDAVEAEGNDDVRAEFLTATLVSTLSPSTLNEARFQYGRDFEFEKQNTSGPLLDLRGFRALRVGMREFLPRAAFPNEKRFQWADNLTWVRGRHAVKLGADINYLRDTIIQVFRGGGIYRWRTANDFARDFAGTCTINGGRCYRDFVQAVDPINADGRAFVSTTDWNFYLQDNFQLRRGLVLNAGLRYELQALPTPSLPNPAVPSNTILNTDSNNFAPRLGLAWQPGGLGRLVVRAGYGIFYGRTPNSTLFSALYQNGISQQAFTFLPTDCAAPRFPNVVFPPPTTAPLGPPAPGLPTPVVQPPPAGCVIDPSAAAITTLAPDFVNPLVQEADLAVEYEPFPDWVIAARYLMSRGTRLPIFFDTNVAPATGTASYAVGDAAGNLTRTLTFPLYTARLDPGLGIVQTGESVVNSWYHAFVLEVRKRFSHGFQLDSHLTISKATDDGVLAAADGTFSGTLVPEDPFNRRGEHALSALDVRRRFVLDAYWELPWRHLQSTAGRIFANGWALSTIWEFRDGMPQTPLVIGSPFCAVNGGLTCGSSNTFGGPAFEFRAPQFGRNTFYGPRSGRATVDLRLSRAVPLGEGRRLVFAWEAFNLFNRTHYTGFNDLGYEFAAAGSAGFSSGLACPAGAGVAGCIFPVSGFLEPQASGTRLLGARQMQLSLRFFF